MIVSHHGQYEFGSPKLPMTLEAVALHLLDNLDAKLHSFPATDARRPERRQPLDAIQSTAGPQAVQRRSRPATSRQIGRNKRDPSMARIPMLENFREVPIMSAILGRAILQLVNRPDYKPSKPRMLAKQLRPAEPTKPSAFKRTHQEAGQAWA